MTISANASVLVLPGKAPKIDGSAFVADGARVVGDVTILADASVWFNAVLRGNSAAIVVGAASNVQDNVSIHTDVGFPAMIGSRVSVGHNAIVHGCKIGDGTLIGMGAVVLSGAVVRAECLVAGAPSCCLAQSSRRLTRCWCSGKGASPVHR